MPYLYAPMLVNLACITAKLGLTVDLCRRLGVDRYTALLSAALVGMLPWTGWLGLSGLAEKSASSTVRTGMPFAPTPMLATTTSIRAASATARPVNRRRVRVVPGIRRKGCGPAP